MKLCPYCTAGSKTYLLLLLLSLVHFNAFCQAGTLDSSFKVNGIFTDFFGSVFTVQPDGKILAAGPDYYPLQNKIFIRLERFTPSGVTDSSFGNNGFTLIDFGDGNQNVIQVKTCPGGKIVVLGTVSDSFVIFKYDADGRPESSFDLDGKLSLHYTTNDVYLDELSVQPDGKLLLAGNKNYGTIPNYYDKSFFITRINLDGSTDTHFGNNGEVTTIFNSQVSYPEDGRAYNAIANIKKIQLQPDGKIVAAGGVAVWLNGYSNDSIAVARYLPDGRLDSSFAVNGKFILDPATPYNENYLGYGASARSLVLQPDGKMVIVASCYYSQSHGVWFNSYVGIIRLTINGTLDNSFDQDGMQFTGLAPYGRFLEAGLQSDGKILLCTTTGTGRDSELSSYFAMARIMGDGSMDTSFLKTGIVIPGTIQDGYPRDGIIGMELAAGRIYVNAAISSIQGLFAFKNDGVSIHPQKLSFCTANGEGAIVSDVQGDIYQWQLSTDAVNFSTIADGANYSGVNTPTLALHNIAAASDGYRFRCLTNKTSSNTTSIHVLTDSDAEWIGAISSQWEDAANWRCNQLPANSTDVVIPSGTVIIHSNVTVHSLTVQPGAAVKVDAGYTLVVLN